MSEKKSLDSIQILRGIAALAVVVHHACLMVSENGSRTGWLNRLGYFPDLGAAGVDIFFVISGFIMVYVSREAFGRPRAEWQFWQKRIVRIVPLYWFYTTLMLLLVLSPFAMKHAVFSPGYAIKSYLFIPAFIPGSGFTLPQPLLATGWTLCYEMFFYFIFGLWLRWGKLMTLVPFILCAFLLSMAGSRLLGSGSAIGVFLGQPMMFEFLYGVIVGVIFVKVGPPARLVARACLTLAAICFAVSIFARAELAWRWLFWGLPSGLLIYGAVGLTIGKGLVARAWARLGDASYTLYLMHVFVTLTLGGILRRGIVLPRVPSDLLIGATVVLCVFLSWFAYLYLELPLGRWLSGRAGTSRRAAPETCLAGTKAAEPGVAA